MTEGFRYALASLGALLLIFGAFLLWWRRADHPGAGGRTRTGAWVLLLVGGVLFAGGMLLPVEPPPAVPPFLLK